MPRPRDVEPKPFFWIALKEEPQRSAPKFHDTFRGWTGQLDIEIEVHSDYLYVGSGQIELVRLSNGQEQARYAFTRRNGQLIIPGTSIKGAVRAVFEAITNSCVRIVAKATKSRGQIIKPDERPWFKPGQRFATWAACNSIEKLCPACRVFGTTGYRGRVYFTDAEPVDDTRTDTIKISELWPPRRTKGRKFYETKAFPQRDPEHSIRFLEVARGGEKFRTTLRFENLSEAELGALIRALGININAGQIDNVFPIKLGGAKPRCLGSVYFLPKQVRIIASPHQSWLQGVIQPGGKGALVQHLTTWLADTSLLDQAAWERFREKAQPRTDEPCPREVY